MEERGLLNDAETMLCVAVVVKQYLQHAVSTGAREHALLAEITHSLPRRSPELPPLHEICGFCGTVVELTAIDAPCAIIALIHLERAMQAGALALLPASWRVLLVTPSRSRNAASSKPMCASATTARVSMTTARRWSALGGGASDSAREKGRW